MPKRTVSLGYCKADSGNLPKIDYISIVGYLKNNPNFDDAELRGVKAMRSSRKSYGDDAVGYVQVKRLKNGFCFVKSLITPEHKVTQSPYEVEMKVQEKTREIVYCNCKSCTAAKGGCKHSLAMIFWLLRRSEEPSVTSTECYWNKPKLSRIGSDIKFLKLSEMICDREKNNSSKTREKMKNKMDDAKASSETIFQNVVNVIKEKNIRNQISNYFVPNVFEKYSVHQLHIKYKQQENVDVNDVNAFLEFMSLEMEVMNIKEIARRTEMQAKSPLWFELRYGRITASKLYDSAHCKTMDGSLAEHILGAAKLPITSAIERGKDLEDKVISEVEKLQKKNRIRKIGLLLNHDYPIYGASADGITDEATYEVKCPISDKTFNDYIKPGNVIADKYKAQMLLQMFFAKRSKGYFCVAKPDFEQSKKVEIVEMQFDRIALQDLLLKSFTFWKKSIFPLLNKI